MSDKITWTNTTVKLGELKPWADNPKLSTKAQAKRILDSWQKFGQVMTVAIDPDKNVLDGHQRLSVLLTLYGSDYQIDARQSNRSLSDEERRTMVLALTNATGSWNWDSLSGWKTEELKEWGFDKSTLSGWKSDVTALSSFLESEKPAKDAPVDVDRAAELLEKWGVVAGDLWQIGEHRLICGDCTDAATVARVMGGERADFSFTDPPYNVNLDYDNEESDDLPKDDYIEWCKRWLEFCPSALAVTSGVKHLLWWEHIKPEPQWVISWIKMNGSSQTGLMGPAKWDPIIVYDCPKDRQSDVIEVSNDYVTQKRVGYKHPGAKPPELWQKIITRFGGDVIYEPFSGSGTTLVACENLSRHCRAIEISPAYVAVALERMATAFPHLEIKRL